MVAVVLLPKPNQSLPNDIQCVIVIFWKCDMQHLFRNVNNQSVFETLICNVSKVSRNVDCPKFLLAIGSVKLVN